jgi:multiple sugar transport system permease protein
VATRVASARQRSARIGSLAWRQALSGYLLVLPVCLILLALVAYPFAYAIVISFTDRVVGNPGKWVGFANYDYLIHWVTFNSAVINTIVLVATSNAIKLVLGLGLALLLNQRLRARGLFRAWVLLPWAMPAFVAFLTWRLLFQPIGGGVDLLLQQLGLLHAPVDWLGQRSTAMPAVIIATVWRGFPFWCIAFLAALQNIPEEQYEAAKIDGADRVQRFQFITLPSIRYTILLVALLSTIWTANSFENVWIMTQGGPSDATMIFPILAYFGLASQRLGEAAAVSVALLPALALLVFVLTQLMLREDEP